MPFPNKEVWKGHMQVREELDQEEKRPDPINQPINQLSNLSQKIPGRTEIETGKTNHVHTKDLTHSISNLSGKMTNNNPLIPDVPFHPGPVYRSLSKPIKQDVSNPQSSQSSTSIEGINPNANFDFKENSLFQEGCYVQNFSKTRQIISSGLQCIRGPHK